MVRKCGDNPPETLILSDFLDEIYEKELVMEGYSTRSRILQGGVGDQ